MQFRAYIRIRLVELMPATPVTTGRIDLDPIFEWSVGHEHCERPYIS